MLDHDVTVRVAGGELDRWIRAQHDIERVPRSCVTRGEALDRVARPMLGTEAIPRPLAEAKAKLSGLIDDVARRDERVTITKHGRPAAVLMSHDEATSLDATLEIMSDPEFYAEILRNQRALDRGEGRAYDLDKLLGE